MGDSCAERRRLQLEVNQLRALLDELNAQKPEKMRGDPLHWKLPTGSVFKRLFQDSVDRIEKKKLLEENGQQSYDDEAHGNCQVKTLGISDFEFNGIGKQSEQGEDAEKKPRCDKENQSLERLQRANQKGSIRPLATSVNNTGKIARVSGVVSSTEVEEENIKHTNTLQHYLHLDDEISDKCEVSIHNSMSQNPTSAELHDGFQNPRPMLRKKTSVEQLPLLPSRSKSSTHPPSPRGSSTVLEYQQSQSSRRQSKARPKSA